MYNEIIAKRLTNLKYLSPMKKSNVTIISKKNNFGDILKLFAQINTDNVIQKISFKASGCSTFLSMCDYFCELIDGKTIDESLKINEDNLKSITTLDKSREHVYSIILDTFKLLIKKYNKGIEKKTIIPCEKNIDIDNKEIKQTKKEKEVEISPIIDEDIIIKKKTTKKQKKINVIKDESTNSKIDNISELNVEPEVILEEKQLSNRESNNNEDVNEHLIEVKEEVRRVETVKEDGKEKTIIEEKKISHLMALRQKINNKENNDIAHNHANSLNNMLQRVNKQKTVSNEEQNEPIVVEENIVENSTKKKDKKSLFSWFKKK